MSFELKSSSKKAKIFAPAHLLQLNKEHLLVKKRPTKKIDIQIALTAEMTSETQSLNKTIIKLKLHKVLTTQQSAP